MAVSLPTERQVADIAQGLGLALSESDIATYRNLFGPTIAAYNALDAMPDNLPQVRYPRTPGYRPGPEENTHNAWYWKTSVKGAANGKLRGKRVALKDNVMLAGVPMMNGVATLEGYIPEVDATIVTRMLDEGAEIVGKAHCESLCASACSHTNATGPIHNPYRKGYSAGGSSSGSGVVVALGEADMAIGGDQGGSIRIPSSLCGLYGMKPTWGLVPYTGIMPLEVVLDHAGPMTTTVSDNALLLEVLAGEDGYDVRQRSVKVEPYCATLAQGVAGLRIAVVAEGFGTPGSDPAVDAKVNAAAERFRDLGARVDHVSIPVHDAARSLIGPVAMAGVIQIMMGGDGYGANRPDLYVTSLMDRHRGWRGRADELSPNVKSMLILGTHIHREHGSRYYGKALNVIRRVRAAYDTVLRDYDLLLMPTTATTATELPPPDAPLEVYVGRTYENTGNTAQFDLTHHPAMSVPCGLSNGLPVGMMLVGRHFEETTIYRAAYAFEQAQDWKRL